MVLRRATHGCPSTKYGTKLHDVLLQNPPWTDSRLPRVNFRNVNFLSDDLSSCASFFLSFFEKETKITDADELEKFPSFFISSKNSFFLKIRGIKFSGEKRWFSIFFSFFFLFPPPLSRYPGALLVAVACLAVRARGVRDNNREAAFIGLAVGLSLPIWISSAIGSVAASTESDREAWLAYGLLATSLLVFLTMFLPKGRQLAALGREATATVIRDRDDAMSSLPGSGYSPSFFHFKPAEASLKRKMHYHSGGTFARALHFR